ncbi:MAG: undecaprenyl-diphosphate phosphatase [Bacteroidota bacterium]|nr:undecaprenyl-diphosphate phosphatase [Bacteroidota bacterium]
MSIIEKIILAIIEGLTEFIPVSSTAHMKMASMLLKTDTTVELETFLVAVQFGGILAVVVVYWKKFFQSFDLYIKLAIGVLPFGLLGLLLEKYIDKLLVGNGTLPAVVISLSLIIVGFVLLYIDSWYHKNKKFNRTNITYMQSLRIGLFQCFALIPGVSRSAATIFGGLAQKLSWKQATEFSFFLAVPTIFAASIYKLHKNWDQVSEIPDFVRDLAICNVVSFIIALITISAFINFINKIGFRAFGIYRIAVGLLFLIFALKS